MPCARTVHCHFNCRLQNALLELDKMASVFFRFAPCPPRTDTLVWHAPKKHYADRMLWNVDRSNVCFYGIAISIRAKSAKGGSADCFDPNRSRAPTAIASLHQFAA